MTTRQPAVPRGEQPALSYFALRSTIGVAAFALPVVLLIGGLVDGHLERSMSAYYYTSLGAYFTGTLAVVGVFLVVYRFGDGGVDRVLTTVAGTAALGVAFFHCAPLDDPTLTQRRLADVHLSCAVVLFALLGLISFWIFAQALTQEEQDRHDDRLYQGLGILIWASIGTILVWNVLARSFFDRHDLLFWFETVCVLSFGLSFTHKGKFVPRAGTALKKTTALLRSKVRTRETPSTERASA